MRRAGLGGLLNAVTESIGCQDRWRYAFAGKPLMTTVASASAAGNIVKVEKAADVVVLIEKIRTTFGPPRAEFQACVWTTDFHSLPLPQDISSQFQAIESSYPDVRSAFAVRQIHIENVRFGEFLKRSEQLVAAMFGAERLRAAADAIASTSSSVPTCSRENHSQVAAWPQTWHATAIVLQSVGDCIRTSGAKPGLAKIFSSRRKNTGLAIPDRVRRR